jgi:TPR repeat protein
MAGTKREACSNSTASRTYAKALRLADVRRPDHSVELSFALLTEAAEAGNAKALDALGSYYEYGIGTPVDLRKAFECYRRASGYGLPGAIYNLGVCYFEGTGTRKSNARAFDLCWLFT